MSFFPLYEGQPLFADVDQVLRTHGFFPMHWIELHAWRRRTRFKYPQVTDGPLPASYGQMMHGDVLYLSHPELLPVDTDQQIERLIRLGVVAALYGHLDHAAAAFARPGVRQMVRECTGVDPEAALLPLSRKLARDAFRDRAAEKLKRLLKRFGF